LSEWRMESELLSNLIFPLFSIFHFCLDFTWRKEKKELPRSLCAS
jgi:hypothetical protein